MSRTLFNYLILGLLLAQCIGPHSPYASYTPAQKDSLLAAQMDSFALARQDDFAFAQERFASIAAYLQEAAYRPLDLEQQIKLDFPVCGGYSDSCRFPQPLCLTLIKEELLAEENPYAGKNFVDYIHTGYYRVFKRMKDRTYAPPQFADSPFSYTLRKMHQDFYDVQMVWEAQWLLVLDVATYEAPVNEYGGGSMEGYWHFFDFKKGEYWGSISVKAQNTPGFMPPTTTEKTVEKTQTKEQYLPNGRRITQREVRQEKQTESLNSEAQYYYAQKNLHRNFKEASQKAFQAYFTNEKGERLYVF